MAICESCGQETMLAAGCTLRVFTEFAAGPVERIAFGDERTHGAHWGEQVKLTGARCRDCGSTPGHLHHPGCCVEECPACGGQVLSCDCDKGYCGYDFDDDDE